MEEQIKKLFQEGVLGFYTGFEVVSIFGWNRETRQAFNVYTIIVAIENNIDFNQRVEDVLPKLLDIGIENVSFAVKRYFIQLDELLTGLNCLNKDKLWTIDSKEIEISFNEIEKIPQKFVPKESSLSIPVNQILKNNFNEGCYIFEWYDIEKSNLSAFLDNPELLERLTERIYPYFPVQLANMSDRLGNMILQLPVTIISSEVKHSKRGNTLVLDIQWHVKTKKHKRELIFFITREDEETSPDFYSCSVIEGEYEIPMEHNKFLHKYYFWDSVCEMMLMTSGKTSFIQNINMFSHVISLEPRIFNTCQQNDKLLSRITVVERNEFSIGSQNHNNISDFQQKRQSYIKNKEIFQKKEFIQYQKGEEQKAIEDIKDIVNEHCKLGVWLIDPYLSSYDILNTLFFCKDIGANIRAITSLGQPSNSYDIYFYVDKVNNYSVLKNEYIKKILPSKHKPNATELIKFYKDVLNANCGNAYGLSLEFRANYGESKQQFHDRFLIFPQEKYQDALVWSLGTSVNSLGKSVHIVQRVSHGQMIANAFDELWNQLDNQECLIWKN